MTNRKCNPRADGASAPTRHAQFLPALWRPSGGEFALARTLSKGSARKSGSPAREPRSFEHHFRPSREKNAVVTPLDTLCATRRDHIEISWRAAVCDGRHRRRTRASTGGGRRPDAALPNKDA